MIITLRGTHGSGKSTVIRKMIDQYSVEQLGIMKNGRPEAYRLRVPRVHGDVYVLGPYETACGGCDAIQPYDRILQLISKYGTMGHVLLEGALVSSSYGRIGRMMEQVGREGVFAFMMTPIEECLSRISARRAQRGDDRPLNPANTLNKQRSIENSRKQVEAAGILRAVDLPVGGELDEIVSLLRGARHEWPDKLDYEAGRTQKEQGTGDGEAVDNRPLPGQISFL